MALKKSELYSSLWSSCDELRGGIDASQYKDYVLVLLFIKYVSSLCADASHHRLVHERARLTSDCRNSGRLAVSCRRKFALILAKCVSVSDGAAFGRLRGPAGVAFLHLPPRRRGTDPRLSGHHRPAGRLNGAVENATHFLRFMRPLTHRKESLCGS